jgi:hypothetical protein
MVSKNGTKPGDLIQMSAVHDDGDENAVEKVKSL